MSNSFDKLSVLDPFIEEVNSYLPEIEANLERLAVTPGDMDALEETYRRTHTIGGSASMMDFLGLAHVAHGMEDILGDALEGLAPLDAPTVALLQRSFTRLQQLVGGIRTGINEEAIIVDDDADYASYRAAQGTSSAQDAPIQTQASHEAYVQEVPAQPSVQHLQPAVQSPVASLPSFDEVLASFKTPTLSQGEEVSWPEEPAAVPDRVYESQPVAQDVRPAQPSALDTLVASTRQPSSSIPSTPQVQPEAELYTSAQVWQNMPAAFEPAVMGEPAPVGELWQPAVSSEHDTSQALVPQEQGLELLADAALPKSYEEMQQEAQALESQNVLLKESLEQLRTAVTVVETQRAEFRGFLDGSKDALDRMENWAGRAMGLNLRNSPEQVRRYLPLSVMWVANNKLKKVLEQLDQVLGRVQSTDEQLQQTRQQLEQSIRICAEEFQQLQEQAIRAPQQFPQETGWMPWEMQVARDAETLRERVVFERQGDLASVRAEIEATLRDELRREFEARPITVAARSELEQQIRQEMHQELEAKRRLQEQLVGPDLEESHQELASRLRTQIEIEVRQEFLDQIMHGGADNPLSSLQMLAVPKAVTSTTSNFIDRARDATGQNQTTNFIDRARDATGQTNPHLLAAAPPVPPKPASSPALPPVTSPVQESVQSLSSTPLPMVSSVPVLSSDVAAPKPVPYSVGGDIGEEAAEIFRLEADEHLQTISMHVAALEKDPTNRSLIQGIRRATHTLKGAAGMMGFRAIADLCHVSEDLLDSIMEGNTAISPPVLSIILDTAETLDVLITGRGVSQSADEAKVQVLRVRYIELLGAQNVSTIPADEDIDLDAEHAHSVTGMLEEHEADGATARVPHGDLNVRVRLQKLDELVNLFGELLVNRSVLEERIARLVRLVSDVGVSSNRLRDVGQKLESRFEAATLPSGRSLTVMPGEGNQAFGNEHSTHSGNGSTSAHLVEFDALELDRYTEFHQLARGLSEGISDMSTLSTEMDAVIRECESVFARENRLTTTFQDRLMKVRLVPISTMTPRLYRAASAVALKQHKQFEFLLEGVETEVDRTVFEEIAGPLLHLMRNAVNHAIETPELRTQKGKPPAGQIKLSAAYEGNQVTITVRDDGTGLDPEHLRSAAIARGLIRADQVLSDEDLIYLIFRPGFSTAEVLSEESGRGVGLDVVRDSVSRLRGTILVDSTPGQGTAFTMKFPTSMAIQSAMMVRVSDQQFAIPTVMVEAIGRLDNFKRTIHGGQPAVVVRNDFYPLAALGQYLSLPVGQLEEKAPLLLVNANGSRVALVVDEIKGKFDVVMKNLGPHLRQVHGIAGGTVLGNGLVVLILELSELLRSRPQGASFSVSAEARQAAANAANALRWEGTVPPSNGSGNTGQMRPEMSGRTPSSIAIRPPTVAAGPERGKHILVVDDSASVRRVVGNMLKQHGWEIQIARDGVEALEMITRDIPAAVLLDIEMPRMDGYELTATLRAQGQYRSLPLIVLTSRAAAKHQQRAMQLGANAYVVKPYQDEELLNTINSLVYGAVTH